ncbi:asparaginase [Aquisalimonas sp.]|uniref:asparaginase n=1 Tax=Aquisalimonas sp. TaxID=1872621 RepID=UPI0025B801D4|nr:asparaginase [Aquisalimonas sp.]
MIPTPRTLLPGALLGAMIAVPVFPGQVVADEVPVCMMIATGGTIAMRPDPETGAPVPADAGEDLLEAVPAVGDYADIEMYNLSNVPSDYMNPRRWIELQQEVEAALERDEVAGVIVSHGTDTLEETGYFLDLTVDSEKPIALIGALRDAAADDFDGPRNLVGAARVCASEEAMGRGAMLVMNDRIDAARDVRKGHTHAADTFHSGEKGYLGTVEPDELVFHRAPERRQHVPLVDDELPRVDIVMMYGGAEGDKLQSSIDNGAEGVVVQALGWGNVNESLYEAIQDATEAGIPVVISSRSPEGHVRPHYGFDGGGKTLEEAGAVFAGDLLPHKARILLMLAMQHTTDADELKAEYFEQ